MVEATVNRAITADIATGTRGVAGDALHEGDGPGEGEDGQRGAAPEDQRGGAEGHQDETERVGGADAPGHAVLAVRVDERSGDHAAEHARGEGRVQGEGARGESAAGAVDGGHESSR
ncbi:hypothetical protein GCM10020256_56690 [Streptomyces thermocoprophilus]